MSNERKYKSLRITQETYDIIEVLRGNRPRTKFLELVFADIARAAIAKSTIELQQKKSEKKGK